MSFECNLALIIEMIFRRGFLAAFKPLTHPVRFPLISELFRKRHQTPHPDPSTNQSTQESQHQHQEQEQGTYDFFQRRKEIDSSIDFSKSKGMSLQQIPENIGKGGIEEVLYWSSTASSPQQINQIVLAFNALAQKPLSKQKTRISQTHLQDFNQKVNSNVLLLTNIDMLRSYAFYAYKFDLQRDDFWEKVEFKVTKMFPQGQEELNCLVDICFLMGQVGEGEIIYNHASKFLSQEELHIDQFVKLYLTFNMLQKGQKQWIGRLVKGIEDNIHLADQQQISSILPALKQAKTLPPQLDAKLAKRALELLNNFDLQSLFRLIDYLGFQHKDQQLWSRLQETVVMLMKGKVIDASLLNSLVLKVMNTYQMSVLFIKKNIIKPIEESNFKILSQLPVTTLSALSKGLYIYQLQSETKHIQIELSKLVISSMTKEISKLGDAAIVTVIQDYNLTRNGSRELYIFLEEVVRIRYLRGFDPDLDRQTIQLLVQIYGGSGMCSRQLYDGLQALIMA